MPDRAAAPPPTLVRHLVALVALVVTGLGVGGLLVGCGDDAALPEIDELACDDGGGCDDAVGLAGRTFSVVCAEPGQDRLGERVGRAGSERRFAEARAIEGEDPADFVALRTVGDGIERCGDLAYVVGVESTWARIEDSRRVVCDEAATPDDVWCTDNPA